MATAGRDMAARFRPLSGFKFFRERQTMSDKKKTTAERTRPVRKRPSDNPAKKKRYTDTDARERGDEELSLIDHLSEMRSRVLTSLVTLMLTTSIPFFFFGKQILSYISKPFYDAVGTSKLQMFSLTEGFTLQLKAALIVSVIVSLPVIIRQVWAFVSPAIDKVHRAFLRNTIIAAIVLFYGGAAFTFFFFTPYTIKMLLTFMPENMELTINASSYLSFLFFFCAAMGLVFEMPLAIMILTRLGIVTPETLSRKRKYAIVIIWIIAAVITPTTDVLTLTLVAVPLMFLYEVSIIISKIMLFRKARRERA